MTFKQRLPFFLVGLTIGIIAVIFFFGKKKTTFDYGPNARVLKNISIKKHIFSEEILQSINSNKIDTSTISLILKEGKADMWNKIKLDTCTEYNIKGTKSLKNIILTVKNCDSTAIIEKVTFK